MGTKRRIASNFFWASASELFGKGTFVVMNIYIARVLGIEHFGIYSLAQAVTSSLWLIVDLGVNNYGIREIAKDRNSPEIIINPLLTMRVTFGFVVLLAYLIFILFYPFPYTEKIAFIGCGLSILTYSFYTDWVTKGLEKFNYLVYGTIISSLAFACGIFLLVKTAEDLPTATFVWSLSYLFGSLSLLLFLSKKLKIRFKPFFDLKTWILHLKDSKYFMISGVILVMYQNLPIYLIGYYANKEVLGLFSAPCRIIMTINNAGFLITASFYPALSQMFKTNISKFLEVQRSFKMVLLSISLPVAILGSLFSHDIIFWVLGKQYSKSQAVFNILIWLVPVRYFRASYGTALFAAGFQRIHNLSTLVGLIIFMVIGSIIIPSRPLEGSSISLLIAELAMLFSMMTAYRHSVGRFLERVNIQEDAIK